MKKLAVLGIASALLLGSGCSQETEPKKETTATKEEKVDLKIELINFQMEVIDVLKIKHKAIAAYDDAVAAANNPEVPQEEKPTLEELEQLKAEAIKASEELAQDVKKVQVPTELDKHKKAIKEALNDLSASYESRSKNIGGDVTEADNLFNEFQTKMGEIFEEEGLLAPDFLKMIL